MRYFCLCVIFNVEPQSYVYMLPSDTRLIICIMIMENNNIFIGSHINKITIIRISFFLFTFVFALPFSLVIILVYVCCNYAPYSCIKTSTYSNSITTVAFENFLWLLPMFFYGSTLVFLLISLLRKAHFTISKETKSLADELVNKTRKIFQKIW